MDENKNKVQSDFSGDFDVHVFDHIKIEAEDQQGNKQTLLDQRGNNGSGKSIPTG